MKKINFENLPATNSPVSATNLNQLQENIEASFIDNLTSTSTTDALSANQGRVLNEKIKCLRNQNIILIGDSLSLMGCWSTKFVNISQCNGQIYGNGSAGFVSGGITEPYTNMNFLEMLTTIISEKTKEDREAIDYIICGGGINDAMATSITAEQLKTNVTEFINLAKTNFPNAKIVVFPIHTFKALTKLARKKYQEIYNTASNLGVMTSKDFIWWTITDRKIDSGDNVHLTDEGYSSLGGKIVSFINGTRNINEKTLEFTLAENVTGDLSLTSRDNKVHLQGLIKYEGSTSPAFNDQLLTMESYLTPTETYPIQQPCLIYGNSSTHCLATISISNGSVNLGLPKDYLNYSRAYVYINVDWEIGNDYA